MDADVAGGGNQKLAAMKRKIKILHGDTTKEVEAEIVRIGDYFFGIYWRCNEYSQTSIVAVELTSGAIVSDKWRSRTCKAPKKALLEEMNKFVQTGALEKALQNHREICERRRQEFLEYYEARMEALEYPLNTVKL